MMNVIRGFIRAATVDFFYVGHPPAETWGQTRIFDSSRIAISKKAQYIAIIDNPIAAKKKHFATLQVTMSVSWSVCPVRPDLISIFCTPKPRYKVPGKKV